MRNLAKESNVSTKTDVVGMIDKIIRQGSEWRVEVHGVYWPARAARPGTHFVEGELVRIVRRQGMIQIIETLVRQTLDET